MNVTVCSSVYCAQYWGFQVVAMLMDVPGTKNDVNIDNDVRIRRNAKNL